MGKGSREGYGDRAMAPAGTGCRCKESIRPTCATFSVPIGRKTA